MLSKFIYKGLMVFALAIFAQVGYSQNYVSSDQAITILKDAIAELEEDLSTPPAVTYTGNVQAQADQTGDKIQLSLMKAVKDQIESVKDVETVMNVWYDKADAEIPARKTKMILALDSVKNLLS